MSVWTWMDTPVGTLKLVASDAGLESAMFEAIPAGQRGDQHPLLHQARTQLEEYFAGTRQQFDVPLSPRGTPFQQACWQLLLRIPYGNTATYGEQAAALGAP